MRGGAAYSYVQLLLSYLCGCAAADSTAGFRSSYMIFAYTDHVKVLQILLPSGSRGIATNPAARCRFVCYVSHSSRFTTSFRVRPVNLPWCGGLRVMFLALQTRVLKHFTCFFFFFRSYLYNKRSIYKNFFTQIKLITLIFLRQYHVTR